MSSGEHAAAGTGITRRYEALLRVSQTLISIRSSEELFRVLARELREVVTFYVMRAGIYDEKAHEMITTSHVEPSVPIQDPTFAPIDTYCWCCLRPQPSMRMQSLATS